MNKMAMALISGLPCCAAVAVDLRSRDELQSEYTGISRPTFEVRLIWYFVLFGKKITAEPMKSLCVPLSI